ncbi:MAG TPA: CheR family methyltransferase, partial [Ferruginibacter sp.]|nr:CheR family methyltransferase [Ferruginibacter sp.]
QLLQNLPANTGMAYIYVQHLSPDHKSLLTSILSKVTAMKVQEIDDMEKIEPDNLYIIPSNKEIEVIDGHIQLLPRPQNKSSNLSIDVLFSSLAETHKENVIGVVLSGSASDGTRGLQEIKLAGGITFAQDDSAKFSSMPKSAIGAGVVDFILSPKEIAKELTWMSKHPLVKRSAIKPVPEDEIENSDPDLSTILQFLYKRKNVDFSYYKMNTIKRRLLRRMLILKVKTLQQYSTLLLQKNQEVDTLFQDLLINVTDFFRDTEAFVALKKTIFPRLIKSKAKGEPLRIWVAACATGEEVYSLAITLLEIQQNKAGKIPFQIFASDLSAGAIAAARIGEYSSAQLKNISPKRLQQFFTKSNDTYRISKSLRDVCVFAEHNILRDPPFSRMDFISCRNMLIYLDAAAQKKVIATFHYALNEGGCLMLGKSETIGASEQLFTILNKNFKIYVRKKNSGTQRIPAMVPRFSETFTGPQEIPAPQKIAAGSIPKKNVTANHGNLSNAFDAYLLYRYMPASVVINYQMDILEFRGPTDQYLKHASGKASFNILKMAHDEITFELRNAIHNAIKTKKATYKSGIEMNSTRAGEVVRIINLEVAPLNIEGDEPLLVIVFNEQHQIEIISDPLKARKSISIAKDRRIKKLEEELADARADMGAITHDQEAANEELQSANEEIVSSNEELQSLNEELETSKEEIES